MATVTASYNWVSGETVTPAKLNTTAAPTVVVADNEVTTAKILDANVTAGKLAATLDLSGKTVTLPDDSVTDAKLSLAANAGEIKKAINADNSPPIYACRAWVIFAGNLDTSANPSTANTNRYVPASGNVSSVLRNGLGDYTINFATAMPDFNYACSISCNAGSEGVIDTSRLFMSVRARTTTSVRVHFLTDGAATTANSTDPGYVAVTIFR